MTATDITIPGQGRPKLHEPGIYFGMPEEEYHADPALGSTDIRRLARNPTSYWHGSWMNPTRPERTETRGQVRGSAMHKLLYEGLPAFQALYICGARNDAGMTAAEKGAATKAANAMAAKLCKTALPSDDYDQVMMATAMITKNPKLKDVFTNGFGEVSIFFEIDGIRVKARIDYLKIRGCGDAKGVANQHDKDFPQACRDAIANYRYDVQAEFYLRARREVGPLWSAGAVFGDHDADLLKKIALSTTFGWQWVFYQTEGAPITWSSIISPGNPILEVAQAVTERGLARFAEYSDRFGETMWLLIEDPRELFQEDMPGWYAR